MSDSKPEITGMGCLQLCAWAIIMACLAVIAVRFALTVPLS